MFIRHKDKSKAAEPRILTEQEIGFVAGGTKPISKLTENTEIRLLTEEELGQVTGGAAINSFVVSPGQPYTKQTGSAFHGNGGTVLGGNGALNDNTHFSH